MPNSNINPATECVNEGDEGYKYVILCSSGFRHHSITNSIAKMSKTIKMMKTECPEFRAITQDMGWSRGRLDRLAITDYLREGDTFSTPIADLQFKERLAVSFGLMEFQCDHSFNAELNMLCANLHDEAGLDETDRIDCVAILLESGLLVTMEDPFPYDLDSNRYPEPLKADKVIGHLVMPPQKTSHEVVAANTTKLEIEEIVMGLYQSFPRKFTKRIEFRTGEIG